MTDSSIITITVDPDKVDLGLQEDLENAKTAAQLIDVLVRITGQSRDVIRSIKLRALKQIAEQIRIVAEESLAVPK
jgi:hypothetical protein